MLLFVDNSSILSSQLHQKTHENESFSFLYQSHQTHQHQHFHLLKHFKHFLISLNFFQLFQTFTQTFFKKSNFVWVNHPNIAVFVWVKFYIKKSTALQYSLNINFYLYHKSFVKDNLQNFYPFHLFLNFF